MLRYPFNLNKFQATGTLKNMLERTRKGKDRTQDRRAQLYRWGTEEPTYIHIQSTFCRVGQKKRQDRVNLHFSLLTAHSHLAQLDPTQVQIRTCGKQVLFQGTIPVLFFFHQKLNPRRIKPTRKRLRVRCFAVVVLDLMFKDTSIYSHDVGTIRLHKWRQEQGGK